MKRLRKGNRADRVRFYWSIVLWMYSAAAGLNLPLHYAPVKVFRYVTIIIVSAILVDVCFLLRGYKRMRAQMDREYKEAMAQYQAETDKRVGELIRHLMDVMSFAETETLTERRRYSMRQSICRLREVSTPGKFDAEFRLLETYVNWTGERQGER